MGIVYYSSKTTVLADLLFSKTKVNHPPSSSVEAITKGSSKDKTVMHLLRSLWFFAATFDIHIVTEHIAGANNSKADMLSRNKLSQFLLANPQAKQTPTPLPPPLFDIISPQGPDWTSHLFRQHFANTMTIWYLPRFHTHLRANSHTL